MEHHVNEDDIVLVEEFHLFVKGGSLGVAPTLPELPGSINSVAVTAKCELCGSTSWSQQALFVGMVQTQL